MKLPLDEYKERSGAQRLPATFRPRRERGVKLNSVADQQSRSQQAIG